MQIHISTEDGTPIYLQIVNQIKYLVASGRLETGEEMPPIRVLAERLLVTPNTVARAYRELEMAGVVEKRRTAGTYVSDKGSRLAQHEQWKILTQRVDALVAEAKQMNVGMEQVVELVRERSAAMRPADDKALMAARLDDRVQTLSLMNDKAQTALVDDKTQTASKEN